MEDKKTAVQVRMRYAWQGAEASGLRKAIEDHLILTLSTPSYINATVVQATSPDSEAEQTVEFGTVQEWLDALGEPMKSYRLYVSQGLNSVDVAIGSDGVNVSMRGEVSRAAEFRTQIEEFATAAGLKPLAVEVKKASFTPAPVQTSGFRRSGNYRLLDTISADEWLKVVEAIRTWTGEATTFNGAITTKADPGTVEEIRAADPWKNAVAQRWTELAGTGFFNFSAGRSADLRLQITEKTVMLGASADNGAAVGEVFRILESTLKVASRAAAGVELRGETKRYYTQEPITEEWVQRYLKLLTEIAASRTLFSGRYREANQEYSVSNFDAWRKEVEQRWGAMQGVGCSISGDAWRQSVDIDIAREQVTVNLNRQPDVAGPGVITFLDYEAALKLDPIPGSPYQYYRFSRTYRVKGGWDAGLDVALADAIKKAIAGAFGGARYVLITASMTENGSQTPYASLPLFEDRLNTGDEYDSATVYLQGPKGRDLTIQLIRSSEKVMVKSSIPDEELFRNVISPFNMIHKKLKPDKPESKNLDAAGQEKKSASWIATWTPLLTGISGFVLGALGLYVNGASAQKNTLEILTPRDSSEIPGLSCRVEWQVTRKSMWRGETPEESRAEVLVTKEGDPKFKEDVPDVESGYTVKFPSSGVYDVTVSPPLVQKRNVRVTVKTADELATKMPAKASAKH